MARPRRVLLAFGLAFLATVVASTDSRTAPVMLQFGDLLFSEGRYSEARAAYEAAQETDDESIQRLGIMGAVRSNLRLGAFSTAMESASSLEKSVHDDAPVLSLYGDALWATGLFEEAEQAYTQALELEPDLPQGHHGLARTLAAKNQLDAALEEAQIALRLEPREGEFHHTAGSILERMRRYDEAVSAFSTYLSLLPKQDGSEQATLARSKIRFLRSFGQDPPMEILEGGRERLHRIPFKLSNDKIIVRGRVNDRRNVDFVLDTGAEHTFLSARTAQRSHVVPIVRTLAAGVGEIGLRGLLLGKIDSLRVGSLKMRNVPALIKAPRLTGNGLPKNERDGLSPLALGLSMSIDYENRELVVGERLPERPAHTILPLRQHRLAVVRGLVNNDRAVNFIVDTGGEVISISRDTAMALGPSTFRRIPLKVYGTSGWDTDAFLLPGVDLRFNEIEYTNFSVVVLNLQAPSTLLGFQVGGIVGHRFLSQYHVDIDLLRSEVRLSS